MDKCVSNVTPQPLCAVCYSSYFIRSCLQTGAAQGETELRGEMWRKVRVMCVEGEDKLESAGESAL